MIKYFRHIRRSLINQNKMGKYFKYALGEILLVIIGILLALQINNWNENRKIKSDLEKSVYGLIEELRENINYINLEKKSCEDKIIGLEKILNNSASDKDLSLVINYFTDISSNPFDAVYTSLKEDKRIQLINNKKLKRELTNFYEYTLLRLTKLSEWHEGFVSDNIDPYVLENIPLKNSAIIQPQIIKQLLTKIKFNNILSYQKVLYSNYVAGSEITLKKAEELIKIIEDYLEAEKND